MVPEELFFAIHATFWAKMDEPQHPLAERPGSQPVRMFNVALNFDPTADDPEGRYVTPAVEAICISLKGMGVDKRQVTFFGRMCSPEEGSGNYGLWILPEGAPERFSASEIGKFTEFACAGMGPISAEILRRNKSLHPESWIVGGGFDA